MRRPPRDEAGRQAEATRSTAQAIHSNSSSSGYAGPILPRPGRAFPRLSLRRFIAWPQGLAAFVGLAYQPARRAA